jgi:hypothetical protein
MTAGSAAKAVKSCFDGRYSLQQLHSGTRRPLVRISAQTERNRPREHGMRARRPYFGAVLNRHHRRARTRLCNTARILDLAN